MLRSLRDGAKTGWLKYILLGLLLFAGGGLVLTDVGGFFRGGGVSNNLVAKGSGIKISTIQFDKNVRRILSRQGMSPQEAYDLGMIDQILNGEIRNQILTREARKLGINVDDATVKKQISKLAEPLASDEVSKGEALRQLLRSQGVSEAEFVNSIRQEMGNTLFRNALLSGATGISKEEATALYKYRNETRDFNGFILASNNVKDITAPSEENLQKYYEANKSDFAIPEKRSVTIATLKKEMLADKVNITDEELRAVYDENIERYKKAERRKLQQAVLSTQSDAQDVFKKVTEGKKDLKDAV
ncbi:MAG TPA: SurA N-terminal domain-containing protein, partial [Alphaproteobacteria bacterium]|nr:SurA N-terminal domain-containing protein [Alphaproteobacteria bacterium]